MLEAAKNPLIFTAIAVWLCSIALIVVTTCAHLSARIRRQFRRGAWAYTVFVLLVFVSAIIRASRGVILPGWFYALMLAILIAPQIALHVAGMDIEAMREQRQ